MMDLGQIRMVLHNNWRLKSRSPWASLCEIVVPLMVTGLLSIISATLPPTFVPANNYDRVPHVDGPVLNVTTRATPFTVGARTLVPFNSSMMPGVRVPCADPGVPSSLQSNFNEVSFRRL